MKPPKPSVSLRHQLLIDQNVQGSLVARTALYSCACAAYFIVILVFTESMSEPDEPLSTAILRCLDEAVFWVPGLMLLTPVIAYDLLKVTNRFAGPIFRLQREMQRLADGENVPPISFREGDYWGQMADTFNDLRNELVELRQTQTHPNGGPDEIASEQQLFGDHPDDPVASEDILSGSNS